MAKIDGICICSNCKEQIAWEYLIPQSASRSFFEVDIIDTKKIAAKRISSINSKPLELSVKCPNCYNVNTVVYNKE